MRIGTRITIATALSVSVTLAIYAWFEVQGEARVRRTAIEAEAKSTAQLLRNSLETIGPHMPEVDPAKLGDDLTRGKPPRIPTGWRVRVLPREQAPGSPAPVLPMTPGELHRLHALENSPTAALLEYEGDDVHFALPLRAFGERSQEVTGAIDVSRSTASLEDAIDRDLVRAILWVLVIASLTTTAVYLLTRNLMSQPMAKLLRGIDDVAKGDLSHVLLSERDDEIGAVASRFNDMTFSLRESRAETQRHNDAKSSLEQRLAHTEKLATIGQIAAEIAHEVGTPLGVIAGRARATQKKANDPETVVKNSAIIAEQTARITRIIQRLLDFARRRVGPPERARVNLNALTLTTMELLASQFSAAKVKTRLTRAEGLPPVLGDGDRLQQVLLNLLLNAVQAMPDGGTLTVETAAVTRQRPGLELSPEQTFVRLEVTDSGVGIPADRRDKIFEPFYTSKDGQGGTGLGLAVCAGIVKEHDGWIEVDDAAEGGAVFRVHLPAADGATDGPERARGERDRGDRDRDRGDRDRERERATRGDTAVG
ncbi:MAG TPA: ATP-binding protein [Kofleriaceae bacterium]|nr:ATP-binding protein [Kofleriaceae bacterium]